MARFPLVVVRRSHLNALHLQVQEAETKMNARAVEADYYRKEVDGFKISLAGYRRLVGRLREELQRLEEERRHSEQRSKIHPTI